MGCSGYKDLLSRYIDNELSKREREELLAHLQHCSKCSHALAKYRQVESLLAQPGREETRPNPAVRDRVLEAIRPASQQPPRPLRLPAHRGRLRWVGLLALTSATFIFTVLLAQSQTGFLTNLLTSPPKPSSTPDFGATALVSKAATATSVAALPPAHVVSVQPTTSPLALDQPIVARFDVAMMQTSVEEAWQIAPPVPGSFLWTADNELTFQPYSLGYLPGITYTLTISNTAHGSTNGALITPVVYSWMTRPAPRLLSHEPAEFASSTPLTAPLTLRFDRSMQHAAVQAAFSLSPSQQLEWTWAADSQSATVQPTTPLNPNLAYVATLGHAALDSSGVSIGRDQAWRFSTASLAQLTFAATTLAGNIVLPLAYSPAASYSLTYTLTRPTLTATNLRFDLYHVIPTAVAFGSRADQRTLLASFAAPAEGSSSLTAILAFDLPAVGDYLLLPQIEGDDLFNRTVQGCLLIVGAEQVRVEQVGAQVILWATSGGAVVAGLAQFYDAQGVLLDSGPTDATGSYLTTLAPGVRPAFAALRVGDQIRAVLPLDGQPAPASTARLYAYSDQRSYQHGESKINFKAILFLGDSAGYKPAVGETTINVALEDAAGAQIASTALRPDDFGAVSGSFPLLTGLLGGWYSLKATALDQQYSQPLYVQGGFGWQSAEQLANAAPLPPPRSDEPANNSRFTAAARSYQVGETAALTLTLPTAPTTPMAGLLLLRRDGMISRQPVVITAAESSFSLPLPTAAQPLAVAELLLADGSGSLRVPVQVGARNPLLDVRLGLPANIHPGTPTTLTLALSNGGQPKRGSVSLAISSQPAADSLPSYFYPPFSLGLVGQSEPGSVAYWNANLVVSESGVLTVPFVLPNDAAGGWWLTARAIGDDGAVGETVSRLTAVEPLSLRPLTPTYFVQGDRATVGVRLHNSTGLPLKGRVTLSSDGLTFLKLNTLPAAQDVLIAPFSDRDVQWRVEMRRSGNVDLVFDFAANSDGSRELGLLLDSSRELRVLVRPVSPPIVSALAGVAEEGQPLTFTIASNLASDLSRVELEVAPSLAAFLLGSIEAMTDAPATGVEQISSQAASVASLDLALRQLRYSRLTLAPASAMLARTLPLVYASQQADGSWLLAGKSDFSTTALTLHNLARLRDSGVPPDNRVSSHAVAYLRSQLPTLQGEDLAYAYYVLALYGAADLDEVRPLLAAPLDSFGQAALILALDKLGDRSAARLLARLLSSQAMLDAQGAHWLAASAPANLTSATVLLALSGSLSDDPNIGRGVRWLAAQRVAGGWGSPRSDAAALEALSNYAAATNDGQIISLANRPAEGDGPAVGGSRPANQARSYRAYLNGTLLNEADGKLTSSPLDDRTRLKLPLDQLHSGANVLRLATQEGVPLYYALILVAYPAINASFGASDEQAGQFAGNPRTVSASEGSDLRLERSYSRLAGSGPLKPGDLVRVALTVTAGIPLSGLMVNDYLPAGLTLSGPEWPAPTPRRQAGAFGEDEVASDQPATTPQGFGAEQGQVSYYLPEVEAGPGVSYRFTYLAQASSYGIFIAPPATVSGRMGSTAHTASDVITIEQEDAAKLWRSSSSKAATTSAARSARRGTRTQPYPC